MSDHELTRMTGDAAQTVVIRWHESAWDAQPGARVVVEVVSVRQDSYPTEESA